jgi:hypothetical protein
MKTDFATLFVAYALTANSVMGYPADYGPFAPGQSPPRFSLRACPLLAEEGPAVVVVDQSLGTRACRNRMIATS